VLYFKSNEEFGFAGVRGDFLSIHMMVESLLILELYNNVLVDLFFKGCTIFQCDIEKTNQSL
jgi:hypothetical protein